MKNVLVSPLDWGMGHATRCIPLIEELIDLDLNVIIASSSSALELLKREFPDLPFEELPEYNPSYGSKNKNFSMDIALQSPKLLQTILLENQSLKKIIEKHDIDFIFSDNRFGVYSDSIPSVFITHQINIQLKPSLSLLQKPLNIINQKYIQKHNECWIPDFKGEYNFSGKLSHSSTIKNRTFIGTLSRFSKLSVQLKWDLTVILSGQEPQRSQFEKRILDQLEDNRMKVLMVRGTFRKDLDNINAPNLQIVNYLGSRELNEAICASRLILSRSGYSSIMDYIQLGKAAILVPAPGQTEQEYLAKNLKAKGYFYTEEERSFDLSKAISESRQYRIPDLKIARKSLRNEIERVLNVYAMQG